MTTPVLKDSYLSGAPASMERGPFASLAELWDVQATLRERRRDAPESTAVWDAVEDFVRRGVATGALIEDEDDRWSIQGLLDYWATALERAGRPRVDASLAEFDPESAPQLADDACPYVGLNAFQEEHQNVFFGREALVERLIHDLHVHRLVALVGPSGCGKSSLAFAGLLPRLRQGAAPADPTWRVHAPIVPGSTPRATLAALLDAIDGDPTPSVVVVDQFEELFTHGKSEGERTGFIEDLLRLVTGPVPHRLVLTVRSDFESFITRHPALYEIYVAGRVAVTPPNASELRRAIEAPADLVGLKFEAGIVDRLLQELLGEPAGLPLLQFTLRRLWEERARNRITTTAYDRIGGGRQALARTADSIYDAMIPEDQATARRILLHLGFAVDSEHELTRARVPRLRLFEHAEDPGRVERVLDRLIAARLIQQTANRPDDELQVEVAHEALVRNWPRLAEWMQEARTSLTEQRRLEAKAMEWVRLGRGRSALLDDVELSDAERVQTNTAGRGVHASADLTALIEASRHRVEATQRRQRSLLSAGVVAIAALLTMLGLTLLQYRNAQDARTQEQQQQYETRRLLGMVDMERGQALLLDGHPMQALPYLVAARSIGIYGPALQMLFGQAAKHAPLATFVAHKAPVTYVSFSPDGRRIVTASQDHTARVWDVATGKPVTEPLQHRGFVNIAAFSPDGRHIVTASGDNTARVWDAATGRPVTEPLKHRGFVISAAFSPDGKRIVTASWDKTASVWDVATGTQAARPLEHKGPVNSAAFSPDGARIVTASGDNTVRVWDTVTGTPITEPLEHQGPVNSAAFSPDGARVVTASGDNTARIWSVSTGKLVAGPLEHHSFVNTAVFSPDGTRIVTASGDKKARVWEAATGKPITELEHRDTVRTAIFSADGRYIVTASDDKTARVWDATTGNPVTAPLEHQDSVRAAAFSPDGTRIVTASDDKTARMWRATTSTMVPRLLEHHGPVNAAAFSPDGMRIVTASDDRTARIWDATTGEPAIGPLEHQGPVTAAAFSSDGRRVITVNSDEAARIWNAATGKQITGLFENNSFITAAAFSPDGTHVVTAGDDKTARVWDAATGKPVTRPLEHQDIVRTAAFSPDGTQVVTASDDRTAQIWSAATGRPLTEPLRHQGFVRVAAFSPDGTRVVTASSDKTVRVWDVATGKPLTEPLEHQNTVYAAAFSPDGTRVVTASNDRMARVWELGVDMRSLEAWRATERCAPFALVGGVFRLNVNPSVSCDRSDSH
jgi:WD40 repeat protein/energy-coupling factor transporter ATP-binding protein EcfA2